MMRGYKEGFSCWEIRVIGRGRAKIEIRSLDDGMGYAYQFDLQY
jgi:hypothetical protein